MLKNYFTSTIRNLRKHSFYTSLNVVGLAIGMAAGFMILQYVYHELSYDHFFANKENIYRVQTNRYNGGELTTQWAGGAAGAGYHLDRSFPEVLTYVNLKKSQGQISVDKKYIELEHPYYARENFFEVFSVPLLIGVDSLVLKEPLTVVLSQSMARKMFGDKNPIGEIITQNDKTDFKVTGVFEDLPENSHMKFDLLYSFASYVNFTSDRSYQGWNWDGFLNYVVLHPRTDPKELEAKLPDWILAEEGEMLAQYDAGIELLLQPLTDIHLTSNYYSEIKPTGDKRTTYFLMIIGLFVLFIAWINYINLTTARAMGRAKEVGIRKVMGSYRMQLVGQFMFESFFINVISFLIATLFVVLTFPYFNDFVGRSVSFSWPDTPYFWTALIMVFIVGILLSGFYPAFVLSNFKPIAVLKGKFTATASGSFLRQGLVTFQFLASVILITGTFVVYKQMNYLQSQDLGVSIAQNIIVKMSNQSSDSVRVVKDRLFKNRLASNASLQNFTSSTSVPGRQTGWNAGGIRLVNETDAESNQYRVIGCDDQYIDFYGLEVAYGRKFDKSFGNEDANVLFTEAAVDLLGFSNYEEVLGKQIFFWGDTFNVVGVLKNFRQESPKQAYDPLIFRYYDSPNGFYSINVSSSNMRETIAGIENDWQTAFGSKIFDFFFLDDYYNEQYEADVKFGSIFGVFASLAIFVACLGLFGLSSFITNLRAKEVGVRKVLGASLQQLLVLLTRDFLKLVLIAILIAAPISFLVMNNWLQNFENSITLGLDIFVIPAVCIVVIALSTVIYHTSRTVGLNPAETLHDE